MRIQDLQVSLFQYPRAYMSALKPFQEIVRLIRYDEDVRWKTENFRVMMENVGKQTANETIKEKLVPAFGVPVIYKGHGHSKSDVKGWTGLAMCDIDGIDEPEEVEATFERLKRDPHVLMVFRSISGHGIKVIYWYMRENGQKISDISWRAAFLTGNEYLARVANHDYDKNCDDMTRLCGLAHDPEVYVNADAEPFVIADDLIVAENCTHQLHGQPRKDYAADSCHVTAEEAWPFIEKMLQEREIVYAPGQHHDFILHAAYYFNRFGVAEEDLLAWASQEWGDHAKEERERAILHKYKEVDRHGTWKLGQVKKKGRETNMVTLPEIREWLAAHVQVSYSLVSHLFFWRYKAEGGHQAADIEEVPLSSSDWKQVDEIFYDDRRIDIALATGKRVLTNDVKSVIKSSFARQVHPIREYVERLPEWDGEDRFEELASHVRTKSASVIISNEEVEEHFRLSFRKWLVGMVATWMGDRETNEQILTFIGAQGIYKTTFFRHLLPPPLHPYFWENTHNSFHAKDDKIALAENCLVEIEEVDAIEGQDMSELKGLVTSQTIKERHPYAEARELQARMASFCASGNEQRILTDKSGDRRWLCFMVESIDNPREWNLNYEQLYAQLYNDYKSGYRYYFDKTEEDRIKRMNQPFRLISQEEELINSRLRKPKGNEGYKLMNATMIAILLSTGQIKGGLCKRKIGIIMHSLNYDHKTIKGSEYYKVVEINFAEQQSYLGYAGDFETDDSDTMQQSDNEQLELPF